ncbi:hypothetical protein DFH09DRAFT_114514 [Mycena vulgaris]|nr:hypothetical protein DFH09DRAFT_114514 [Mycena vulgaris]
MDLEERPFNRHLFVENGKPLKFYLHESSIKQQGARLALQTKIQRHGGVINPEKSGSNIIIVNPDHPSGSVEEHRHMYKTHSDPSLKEVKVEPMRWVGNAVKLDVCVHLEPMQKGMGGVAAGRNKFRERTEFTALDDWNLCNYVGQLIPNKADGGRTGNNIYKMLMRNAELDEAEYGWALRHTWESWRERYKKNQPQFDENIKKYVVSRGVAQHQKYHLSRNAPRGKRTADDMDSTEEEEEEEEEDVEHGAAVPSRTRPISGSGSFQREAKRQRRGRSPSPHADVIEDVENAQENAPPDDDDGDGYISDGSLFGGPSGTSPPPEVHLATQPIRSSQDTLVGTAPVRRGRASGTPRAQKHPVEPPTIQESPPRRQQPARSTRPAARPAIPRPPKQKANFVPEIATLPEIVEDEAPRRLRSRSRSVEPTAYVDDIDAIMRKNRQKGKKKALEPVEEQAPEPEVTEATTQEEQNVEDLLMAANDQSGISDGGNVVEEEVSMPPPREARRQVVRGATLETDDGQTDLALRHRKGRQVSFSPAARSSVTSTYDRAKKALKQLGGPRLSRPPEGVTSKAAPSRRFAQNSPSDVFSGQGSHRVSSVDPHNPFYTQSAGRASVSRKDSTTSTESFPLPRTRARGYKHDTKAQEKRTPYRPPTGTRAAELVEP